MLRKAITLLLFTTTINIFADHYQKGNEEFTKKNYKEAISCYLLEIEENGEDVNTLFNLGNAYLALNREGEALYSFYKAQNLDPHDQNIKTEIVALEEELDIIDQYPLPLVITKRTNQIISLGIIFILSSLIFIITLLKFKNRVSNIFYRIRKPLAVTLTSILTISLVGNFIHLNDNRSGIILSREEVLISPYPNSDISFTISDGSKVEIDETFKGKTANYLYITDKDGRYGWVEESKVGWLWQ